MGTRRVAVHREWLLRLLKAIDGSHTRFYLPDDAKLVDMEYRPEHQVLLMTLESERYDKSGSYYSDEMSFKTEGIYRE